MNTDDYTQSVEAVIAQERAFVFPVPLKAESYRELFKEWRRINPKAAHEIELTALAIDRRGMTVSAKYLIERVRKPLLACCGALHRPVRQPAPLQHQQHRYAAAGTVAFGTAPGIAHRDSQINVR